MKKGYFTVNDKFLGKCKLINIESVDILYFYDNNGNILFSQTLKNLIEKNLIRLDYIDSIEIFGVYNFLDYSGTFHLFSNSEDILIEELTNSLSI